MCPAGTVQLTERNILNIIALDQEDKVIVAVINGGKQEIVDLDSFVPPKGIGLIVADSNVWAVFNGRSASQYCWKNNQDRQAFLDRMAKYTYKCLSVSSRYARKQYLEQGLQQSMAATALYNSVKVLVDASGRFDSGKPVRDSRGDISYGQRDLVVQDFLLLQNSDLYSSKFIQHAVEIAWKCLDKDEKKLFNLKIRTAEISSSPNRIAAVVVATHDPKNGARREYNGVAWGVRFITRRILCLNGTMMGTGSLSPGSPMRAVLRVLGKRHSGKPTFNPQERAMMDRTVKKLIREFQKHKTI